jgi:glucose-6-phosphate 1-dehydrogenase
MAPQQLSTDYQEAVTRFSRSGAPEAHHWNSFADKLTYLRADLQSPQTYADLAERIRACAHGWNTVPDVIQYLALPPQLFVPVTEGLGQAGLAADRIRARVVLEKPLGRDLASFCAVNTALRRWFDESQIFRIDHYLGKETVQNILALRFGNPMFEPVWNRQFVDHVAITVAEQDGIGGRGGYYETAGALRDMVQNHLMQLLCLVAMEPPSVYTAEQLRNRKMDVMQAIAPISKDEVARVAVRGQYEGAHSAGEFWRAYRDEPGVAADSLVETYAALRLSIENWRWQGVPFYLRSGKRLAEDCSEIAIRFRRVPHCFFPNCVGLNEQPAELLFQIKPIQGVAMRFAAKVPGYAMVLQTMALRFNYEQVFGRAIPEAYETLLREVFRGDSMLFMRADQVEAAWALLEPVLHVWAEEEPAFPNYAPGSWGPTASDQLLATEGRAWRYPVQRT